MAFLHLIIHFFLVGSVLCAEGPIVNTPLGSIQGVYSTESRNFNGIKFAQAPIGPLRWKPPVAVTSWSPALYNASHVKPGCPQTNCYLVNPSSVCPTQMSEDCLHLNVFTPLDVTNSSRLPVMVFLHGGNFVHMDGGSALFRGDVFVNKSGVILVTTNYRLGVLGFLVTNQGSDRAQGNYGIQDQRLVMEWVRDNIRGFGGDPEEVTLIGQSAGAQSIAIHMMSARSEPLFKRAIMQSEPFTLPMKFHNQAVELGEHLAYAAGCSRGNLACLRGRTWQDLGQAEWNVRDRLISTSVLQRFEPWGPCIDGDEVAAQPLYAFQNGVYQRKPFMLGTTAEEAHIFIYLAFPEEMSIFTYLGFGAAVFGLQTTSVLARYSPFQFSDKRRQLARLATDFVFDCPNRAVARKAAEQNRPVWLYMFDHTFSFNGWENMTFCQGRACHGGDLVYAFQSAKFGGHQMNPSELRVSNSFMKYLSNFAKYGTPIDTPGGDGEELWPQYQATQYNTLEIADPNRLVSNRKEDTCDFWDTIGYNA